MDKSGLAWHTAESSFNFSHEFLPSSLTAAHMYLLSSPASHSGTTANAPSLDFNIIAEIIKSFRRFKGTEINDLKNEII